MYNRTVLTGGEDQRSHVATGQASCQVTFALSRSRPFGGIHHAVMTAPELQQQFNNWCASVRTWENRVPSGCSNASDTRQRAVPADERLRRVHPAQRPDHRPVVVGHPAEP